MTSKVFVFLGIFLMAAGLAAAKDKPDLAKKYFERGNMYAGEGKYDEALKDFNDALKISPKDARLYFCRSNVYVRQNKNDLALADLRKTVSLAPKYGEAYWYMAVCYFRGKDYKKAWDNVHQAEKSGVNLNEGFRKDFIAALKQEDTHGG